MGFFKIYSQFKIDLPRLTLYLDKEFVDENFIEAIAISNIQYLVQLRYYLQILGKGGIYGVRVFTYTLGTLCRGGAHEHAVIYRSYLDYRRIQNYLRIFDFIAKKPDGDPKKKGTHNQKPGHSGGCSPKGSLLEENGLGGKKGIF